ncbi:MAG: DUF481 domain-containing protein [Planctomycetota bacterium]
MALRSSILAMLLLTTTAATARADKVYLTDGAILTGNVVQLADEVLTLKTDYADEVKVDTAKVVGITTKDALAARLETGTTVAGRLVYDPDTKVQQVGVEGAAPVTTSVTLIEALWTPGTDSPLVATLRAQIEAERGDWSAELEAGVDGQTGNSETINVNAAIGIFFETPRERFKLYARQRYARDDGERSTNEALGGAKLEVDITNRWFAFAGVELEFDEFENLDLRTTVTAGLGYFIIRREGHQLKTRAGIGYKHESYDDGTSTDDAVAEIGVAYVKQINDRLRFTHETTYFPTFADLGDYRLVIENALKIDLNHAKTITLRTGVRNEYDSQPQPDVERLDTYYFMNLGVMLD